MIPQGGQEQTEHINGLSYFPLKQIPRILLDLKQNIAKKIETIILVNMSWFKFRKLDFVEFSEMFMCYLL